MEVKDTNALNKSVISLWNLESTKDSENDEQKDEEDKKNEKKRLKNSSSKQVTKRQKSKLDHTPPSITLSSLGGLEEVTKDLLELIGLPILHLEIYTATGSLIWTTRMWKDNYCQCFGW